MAVHGFWPGIVSGQGQGPGAEAGILLGEIPGATFKVLRRVGAIDAEVSRGRGHKLHQTKGAFWAQGPWVPPAFLIDHPKKERLGQTVTRGRLSSKLPQRVGVSSVRFGGRGEGVGWCYAVDGSELIICIFNNCRVL